MLKKGILFSIDAIIALIVAGALILACFFILSKTTTNMHSSNDVFIKSLDSLAILEKDGTLKNVVETTNASTIQQFIDSTPAQFCSNITILSSASAQVLSVQKTGCTAKNESSVALRSFVSNNFNLYYARMEAWYS